MRGDVQMMSKFLEIVTSFPCHHFPDENFPSNGHLLSLMTSYIHGLLGILEISLYAHTAKVNSNLFQDQGMGHPEHKCLMSSMPVIKET